MIVADNPERRKAIKERFEQLSQARLEHENSWSKIASWMQPRRSFTIERSKNQLTRRRIVDMTGARSGERLAQLLHGYLIDTHEPWIEPTLEQGEPNPREMRWFNGVQIEMHKFLISPRSTFRGALIESLTDDVFFGNSVMWPGVPRPGAMPIYKSLPLFECYWAENEDGVTDTLYRRFKLTLKNAASRFPTEKLLEKTKVLTPAWNEEFTFIHATEPRSGGRLGASSVNKPFTSTVFNADTDEIASDSGFDRFPFAITRFQRQSGDVYGSGPGWTALPLVVLANMIEEDMLESSGHAAKPALLDLTGRIEQLDRRRGAVNSLNVAEAMLMDPSQVIQKLYEGGDIGDAFQLWQEVRQEIELIFYVDWMRRLGGQPPSATQVNDERDIRLKSLSGVVARSEQEKMTPIAERTFDAMQAADRFAPPPVSLADKEILFTYRSPLATAQKKIRLEGIATTIDLMNGLSEHDPDVKDIPDTDGMMRDGMIAAGMPLRLIRDSDDVKQRREARQQQEQQQRQLDDAAAAAGAARDAGQAIASVQGGGQ
jgi:head-to-tail connecting protein